MNELIEFLTSEEVILVYVIAGLSCVICLIVYVVEKNTDKRRKRHNTRELNKLVEQIKEVSPQVEEDVVIYDEPVLETISDSSSVDDMLAGEIKNVSDEETKYETYEIESEKVENSIEELEYTSIEPDQETAKLELKKLEEQLAIEEEKKNEEVIIEQLEIDDFVEEDKNIKLTSYEEGQEAGAIISLDELLSKGKELYDQNEVTQYEDEGNEPISIQDLEARMGIQNTSTEVIEEENSDVAGEEQEIINVGDIGIEPNHSVGDIRIEPKFKSSPIISPIFGIESINNESANELELENTANYEKLDQEIKKTNEFLMTLKELQNKLE